jgi:hypothetical protein
MTSYSLNMKRYEILQQFNSENSFVDLLKNFLKSFKETQGKQVFILILSVSLDFTFKSSTKIIKEIISFQRPINLF